ncbi:MULTISPECIES: MgtC/SapB family protein [Acidobacteriaceae]|uniref:MgtC/SapB family protein n=1 Tax=Acidobacteriaceae TaxID=204434 RepID=UPI00131B4886|nr:MULTISPECIES: MgtC/SapB family protein [Acidobacteriaceae]MDW5264993.1 MgtC/SapB family protein [Edaphobacter sp.]
MTLPPHEIALRLVTATVLAGLVGLDRERHRSAAGLRTHALVGMSSCLLMIVSAFGFVDILGTPGVGLDPSRIAAQIVTGIGFLGAGTIIAHGDSVRGLTTAASIWSVAALGVAVGGGMYRAAILGTALALILLLVMRPIERRLDTRWRKQTIRALYDPQLVTPEVVLGALRRANLNVIGLSVEAQGDSGKDEIEVTLLQSGDVVLANALQIVAQLEGVQSAKTQ